MLFTNSNRRSKRKTAFNRLWLANLREHRFHFIINRQFHVWVRDRRNKICTGVSRTGTSRKRSIPRFRLGIKRTSIHHYESHHCTPRPTLFTSTPLNLRRSFADKLGKNRRNFPAALVFILVSYMFGIGMARSDSPYPAILGNGLRDPPSPVVPPALVI